MRLSAAATALLAVCSLSSTAGTPAAVLLLHLLVARRRSASCSASRLRCALLASRPQRLLSAHLVAGSARRELLQGDEGALDFLSPESPVCRTPWQVISNTPQLSFLTTATLHAGLSSALPSGATAPCPASSGGQLGWACDATASALLLAVCEALDCRTQHRSSTQLVQAARCRLLFVDSGPA